MQHPFCSPFLPCRFFRFWLTDKKAPTFLRCSQDLQELLLLGGEVTQMEHRPAAFHWKHIHNMDATWGWNHHNSNHGSMAHDTYWKDSQLGLRGRKVVKLEVKRRTVGWLQSEKLYMIEISPSDSSLLANFRLVSGVFQGLCRSLHCFMFEDVQSKSSSTLKHLEVVGSQSEQSPFPSSKKQIGQCL